MLIRYIRDELDEVLELCRDAKIERDAKRICVKAADSHGFDVRWIDAAPEVIVCFAGWHTSFTDAQSAVRLFRLGLTQRCRLTVETVGAKPRRWLVERWEMADGAWHEIGETSLLMLQLWRPVGSVMLRNNWVETAASTPTTAEEKLPLLRRTAG